MKKYFFISFKSFNGRSEVGSCGLVVGCSCGFDKIEETLLNYYNGRARNEANDICITSLTVLDKQTAAQLSNNFTYGALIIDDGDKEEEKQESSVNSWITRDKNGMLYLYVCNNPPQKKDTYWMTDDGDCAEMDSGLFQEVKWSDEEPTKVRLVIDK